MGERGAMFFGEYTYKVDDKGRLPLPSHFREYLKDGLVILPGVEKCLIIYPVHDWIKLAQSLTTPGSLGTSKMRRLNRALFASAFHLNLDRQGRINIPSPLREYGGLGDEVVVCGANGYIEVWDKELWADEVAKCREQTWQIIESMEKR